MHSGARSAAGLEGESGFAAVATIDQVREYNYALSAGRYVGSEELDGEGEPFEELFPQLVCRFRQQSAASAQLTATIEDRLSEMDDRDCSEE